jgi:hypothetical protein
MGKAKEFDFEKPAPVIDEEDEATLAAIDEGLRDARAGRTVPMERFANFCPSGLPPPLHAKSYAVTNPGPGQITSGLPTFTN